MSSIHQICCKKTGEGLAMLEGGGWCKCPSAEECVDHPKIIDHTVEAVRTRRRLIDEGEV